MSIIHMRLALLIFATFFCVISLYFLLVDYQYIYSISLSLAALFCIIAERLLRINKYF